jgi:Ribosomal L18 C-terminal region
MYTNAHKAIRDDPMPQPTDKSNLAQWKEASKKNKCVVVVGGCPRRVPCSDECTNCNDRDTRLTLHQRRAKIQEKIDLYRAGKAAAEA